MPVRSSVDNSEAKNLQLNRLKYTRAILDAIHSGELAKAEYEVYEIFNLHVPISVTGVPSEILNPQKSWRAREADLNEEVTKLAKLFLENFKKYEDEATPDVVSAGEYPGEESAVAALT